MPIYWREMLLKAKRGYVLDKTYEGIYPLQLGFDTYDVPTLPHTIQASGTNTAPIGYRCPAASYEGGFEAHDWIFEDSTNGTASANFTVKLTDFNGRGLSNNPLHVRTLMGTAQLPAHMREPLWFNAREKLQITPAKISAGSTTWRSTLNGVFYDSNDPHARKRIQRWRERSRHCTPYYLTTSATISLTGNQNDVYDDIIIGNHCEFFSMAAVSTGNFAMEIVEVQSGKTLTNGRFTNTNALGDATLPTLFPKPYFVPKGARIRTTFQDLSGSSNNIYITFHGRKFIDIELNHIDAFLDEYSDLVPVSPYFYTMQPEMAGVI